MGAFRSENSWRSARAGNGSLASLPNLMIAGETQGQPWPQNPTDIEADIKARNEAIWRAVRSAGGG